MQRIVYDADKNAKLLQGFYKLKKEKEKNVCRGCL